MHLGVPELIVLLSMFALGSLIALVPMVFYLLTLQKALSRCAPERRTLLPGQVWLLLIPFFNLVWNFFVVSRVASTLANEFRARKLPVESEPGKAIGLAYSILFASCVVPILGFVAVVAGVVCWVIYWVKIAEFSARLATTAPVGA